MPLISTEISTEIQINSSKEQVWELLTNFARYSEWNSFIAVDGVAEVGSPLVNEVQIGKRSMTFQQKVLLVEPCRKLEWGGVKLPFGAVNGRHCFEIIELNDQQVRVVHTESFSGWLSRLVLKFSAADTERGFEIMNAELKKTAEAL